MSNRHSKSSVLGLLIQVLTRLSRESLKTLLFVARSLEKAKGKSLEELRELLVDIADADDQEVSADGEQTPKAADINRTTSASPNGSCPNGKSKASTRGIDASTVSPNDSTSGKGKNEGKVEAAPARRVKVDKHTVVFSLKEVADNVSAVLDLKRDHNYQLPRFITNNGVAFSFHYNYSEYCGGVEDKKVAVGSLTTETSFDHCDCKKLVSGDKKVATDVGLPGLLGYLISLGGEAEITSYFAYHKPEDGQEGRLFRAERFHDGTPTPKACYMITHLPVDYVIERGGKILFFPDFPISN